LTYKILNYMDKHLPPTVPISIKPSIDGIGEMHDYVRGIKGNFAKLEETIDRLLVIRSKNPRLHVDLGTVISNLNIHHLNDIEDWVHNRGIESYRHEIAEQRVEFHNIGDPITPPPDVYERLTLKFADKIIRNIKKKAFLTRTTEAVRVAYYDVAIQILKQKRQVTPCYGGLSNIHLNYNGDVWPCCILGAEKNLGNVRDWNYDMQTLTTSDQAKKSRKYIADKNCACPLANQWLTNVLLTPRHMLKALYNLFIRFPFSKTKPANEHQSRTVDPAKIRANITGTSSRQALVLHKAGTIPKPEMVDLPEFGEDGEVKYPVSSRILSLLEKEKKLLHRVKVRHVRQLSPSTYVLRVDRNDIEFIPGQYVSLGKNVGFLAREYTIYSSIEDDFLEFLIVEVKGGAVSPVLKKCVAGDILELEGPDGYFHLEEKDHADSKHCFIATGTGIAPFHSFTRSYPKLNYTLLHGVRYIADRHDIDAYDSERYIDCISREEGGKFYGRVTDYIKKHPVDSNTICYLCGNSDMIFDTYDLLVDQGISRGHIISEIFY
jgi:ferredoxin-NADP reductase